MGPRDAAAAASAAGATGAAAARSCLGPSSHVRRRRKDEPAPAAAGGGGGLVCREELAAPLLEALQGVAQLPVRVSDLGEAPLHVENKPDTAGQHECGPRLVGRGWPHLGASLAEPWWACF